MKYFPLLFLIPSLCYGEMTREDLIENIKYSKARCESNLYYYEEEPDSWEAQWLSAYFAGRVQSYEEILRLLD